MLDRFDLIILDDIGYAQKDQAETSVLFELIARRYETRSLAIAAKQPFRAWNRIFPDEAVQRSRDRLHWSQAARLAGPATGPPPPASWGSASADPWPSLPASGRPGLSQTEPIGVQQRL